MITESSYQQKFEKLADLMPRLIDEIKKDLKNDHLRKNLGFVREHFPTKNLNKIGTEEMVPVYYRLVVGGNEALGEYLATRWLLKHGDLYGYFEKELTKVTPDFTQLKELDSSVASQMMETAVKDYGAIDTYLFCLLNAVVFPSEVYSRLETLVKQEQENETASTTSKLEQHSLSELRQEHERVVARLTDRYEKKLDGLERKYLQDVGRLQTQLANLQRKVAHSKS